MTEIKRGKYYKADIQEVFGLTQQQIDRIVIASWEDLPRSYNVLDSRKVFTDETIEYIEQKFWLKRKK